MSSTASFFLSYVTLRRIVGMLGFALPIVLVLWGFVVLGRLAIQPSISEYYDLRTRDAFVGVLCVVAFFLFSYRGYDRRDNIAGCIASVFALGVAFFPHGGPGIEPTVHFTSAIGFFLTLSYFSLFLFTASSGVPSPQKIVRNRVYRTCGAIMLGCIVLIGVYFVLRRFNRASAIDGLNPVFWMEALALWAFGISWCVKGETFLRDVPGVEPA